MATKVPRWAGLMDWRYSFGSVHMLYVNTQVNGVNVKAFVEIGRAHV